MEAVDDQLALGVTREYLHHVFKKTKKKFYVFNIQVTPAGHGIPTAAILDPEGTVRP